MEQAPGVGFLQALELSPKRSEKIIENLQRLQPELLENETVKVSVSDAREVDQWWDGTTFDKILLDAPCSATGVIRRHPDIKWLRREEDIAALSSLQLEILNTLWQTLKSGGTLLYCTCSILEQENDGVISQFLNLQTDASLYTIQESWGETLQYGRQWLPSIGGPDGFYYARLKKA